MRATRRYLRQALDHVALGPLLWGRVELAKGRDPLEQTAWDWAVLASASIFDRTLGVVGALHAVVGFAAGFAVSQLVSDYVWAQFAVGVVATLLSYWSVPTALAVGASLRAPYKQRDDARALIGDARDLKARVLLERHLRAVKDANERALEDIRERAGPLEKDAFGEVPAPWIVGENEQLRMQVEHMGFPELIPDLVLDDPSFATWEEVRAAAWKFARNLNSVLESEFFAEVRKLDHL